MNKPSPRPLFPFSAAMFNLRNNVLTRNYTARLFGSSILLTLSSANFAFDNQGFSQVKHPRAPRAKLPDAGDGPIHTSLWRPRPQRQIYSAGDLPVVLECFPVHTAGIW